MMSRYQDGVIMIEAIFKQELEHIKSGKHDHETSFNTIYYAIALYLERDWAVKVNKETKKETKP